MREVSFVVPVAIESRVMKTPTLSSLNGLADIGLRSGVDMRPILIRVLTDLYVQKLTHTADEERHYTELALRLLDGVDVATRATVAARLSKHLSPPPQVIQYLVNDLPEIAAPLRGHALLRPPAQPAAPAPVATAPAAEDTAPIESPPQEELIEPEPVTDLRGAMDSTIAAELDDIFFTADEHARRLILLSLHVVAPMSPGQVVVLRDPAIGQRLEAAALGNHRDELVKQLAEALRIPREQARRIVRDDHGEPIVVAVKALGIPRDVVYRLLMFVNPAVGHSVERVHALATLYDEMTAQAAEGMVAIWQAVRSEAHSTAKHQPLLWNDERSRARPAAPAARRPLAAPRTNVRREVS
ncbi:MAG TPA: DUF2336 domain-containing protein [Xanthobacteraceae bacterium]|nr:DUF2336 domain-containing protein [Xanthobacteraceae bacterium]